MSQSQPFVFISYSHQDEVEKDKLLAHLGVLQQAGLVDLWSDDRIRAGRDWETEISQAIVQAKVAILLITANFLTSDFNLKQELPQLLQRRQNEGLIVFPVIARACAWDTVDWLHQMAVRPQNHVPVWGEGGSHVDEDLAEIAREVAAIIKEAQEQQARLFICYKRNSDPDQMLADYLSQFLTGQGHQVFMDRTAHAGDIPFELIDQQIKASDCVILLLSKNSVNSEMVQAEVRRAYEYRQLQGHPHILPVRMAYEGLLPYAIEALLSPSQYVTWRAQADNEHVGRDVLEAIAGHLPQQEPIKVKPVSQDSLIFEDGSLVTDADSLHPPLPGCDPRLIEELEAPGGTVKLRDKFYIGREADAQLKRQIVKTGTITTIRASRQKGKSSLLVRGTYHARQNGAKVMHLDLQRVDSDDLETPDHFLHYLAGFIVRKLRLNPDKVEQIWSGASGPQDKLTYLLEDYVLPTSDTALVLAIDEADSLLQTDFYNDFFGMIRAWHNSAAFDEQWEKLNLVLVISTEPYLLISTAHHSPFNVGLKLYLEDFNEKQVRDLNWRHGAPVSDNDFPQLMALLGGHPYLTRKALYHLVTESLTWTDFIRAAAEDDGPFGDHLRRQHWLLRAEPELKAALKQVVHTQHCPDEALLFRLLRAGLIKKTEDGCACRCDLYRIYFADRL